MLGEADPAAMAESVRASLAADHVLLGAGADAHPYLIDVVPRVFAPEEWRLLAAGLGQRLRALEAFLADAYGPREAVRAGVVAADLIDGSLYFERDLAGLPAPPVRIGMAGPDVVRGADGRLLVLEDNVRTPSLQVYALAARRAVAGSLEWPTPPVPVTPEAVGELLRRVLLSAAPELDDPAVAVLTDVERSAGPWQLHRIAPLIGVPRVELAELAHAGD